MRNLMEIRDKRSGSIFQNFDRGNISTNDKCHLAIPWARSCQYQLVCQVLSNITTWKNSEGQFHFFFFSLFVCVSVWIWTLTRPRPTDGKWYLAIPWARSCLYKCLCIFYQNITHGRRVWARFSFFRIMASAKSRPVTVDIPQYTGLELVNINAYAFFVSKYSTPFKW